MDEDDVVDGQGGSTTAATPTTTTTTTTATTTTWSSSDYQGDEDAKDYEEEDDGDVIVDVDSSSSLCSGSPPEELTMLRGELYAFRGRRLWRFSSRGVLRQGYPADVERMFGDFGSNLERIDAAYERRDGNLVFFSGMHMKFTECRFRRHCSCRCPCRSPLLGL